MKSEIKKLIIFAIILILSLLFIFFDAVTGRNKKPEQINREFQICRNLGDIKYYDRKLDLVFIDKWYSACENIEIPSWTKQNTWVIEVFEDRDTKVRTNSKEWFDRDNIDKKRYTIVE